MTCDPCQKRREMAQDAYQENGWKGVMKELPAIARDVIKNPPHIRARTVRNG